MSGQAGSLWPPNRNRLRCWPCPSSYLPARVLEERGLLQRLCLSNSVMKRKSSHLRSAVGPVLENYVPLPSSENPLSSSPRSGTWILPSSWTLKGSCAKQPSPTTTRCAKSARGGGDFRDSSLSTIPCAAEGDGATPATCERPGLRPRGATDDSAAVVRSTTRAGSSETGSDAGCKTLNVTHKRSPGYFQALMNVTYYCCAYLSVVLRLVRFLLSWNL